MGAKMIDGPERSTAKTTWRRFLGLGLVALALGGTVVPAEAQDVRPAARLPVFRPVPVESAPRDDRVEETAQDVPPSPVPIPPVPGLPFGSQEPQTPQTPEVRAPRPIPDDPGHPPIALDTAGQVSLHVNEADIRAVLELLSRETTGNILISPGVQGTISVNIERRTPEQALEAILKLGNLSSKTEGGLIYVYSPQEVAQQGERGDLVTRVYHLNYVRAADIDTMIRPFLSETGKLTSTPASDIGLGGGTNLFGGFGAFGSAGGSGGAGGGGGGGGSAGGVAGSANTGGNSLAGGDVIVVQDFEANIKTIDDLVRRLDIQPIQVLVEAVIMAVEVNRDTNLGINFAVLTDDSAQGMALFGNGQVLSTNAGFTPSRTVNALGKIVGGIAPGFLGDNSGFKYGAINDRTSAFINALEQVGQVNVLASPRVLVLNKQRAEIQLGQRLGYQTVVQNLTSAVQQVHFLNTGTLLRFRPFVSSDGMIRMEVHPEKSTGEVVANLPRSNTSEVTTNVMVPDGATIVIGGLIENTDTSIQQGTLGLSRMPVLGPLFRMKAQSSLKRELIVLLTPRIWNPAAIANLNPGGPPVTIDAANASTAGRSAPPVAVRPGAPPPSDPAPPAMPASAAAPRDFSARREPAPPAAPTYGQTPHRTVPTAHAPDRPPVRRHVVRSGENFWTISRLYYGSGRYYQALWAANRDLVDAPDRLEVGMRIVVPDVHQLDDRLVAPPGRPAAPAPRRVVVEAPRRDDGLRRASVDLALPPAETVPTPARRGPAHDRYTASPSRASGGWRPVRDPAGP